MQNGARSLSGLVVSSDMKIVIFVLVLLVHCTSAFARLGDTQNELDQRYGCEKKPANLILGPLLETARDLLFVYQGWKIRCSLLMATDGKEYVVREEYTKIWNDGVMKAGGTILIQDFERDAILKAETGNGTWKTKIMGDVGSDISSTFNNQLAHIIGIPGKVWVREDGAIASMPIGSSSLIFNLPQAIKYEEQVKANKRQKLRAAIPQF